MKWSVQEGRVAYRFEVEPKDSRPVLVRQVHGAEIYWHATKNPLPPAEADAVITREPKTEAYVFTADCLSVLAWNSQTGMVAAVHAGWRGVKKAIIAKTIECLGEASAIRVALGPCIHACCFEVREDFIVDFESERGTGATLPYVTHRENKKYFDIAEFVIQRELVGVPRENIECRFSFCTYCSKLNWPSYRRNGGTDPRIRSSIRLLW